MGLGGGGAAGVPIGGLGLLWAAMMDLRALHKHMTCSDHCNFSHNFSVLLISAAANAATACTAGSST